MKNTISLLALFSLFFIAACGKSDPRDKKAGGTYDYDSLAKELCVCLRPMVDLQQEVMTLLAEGKEQEMMALQTRAQQVQADGEACVLALETKYGVIETPDQEALAQEALRKVCPDIVSMMEGASGMGGADPSLDEIPMEELEEALQKAEE